MTRPRAAPAGESEPQGRLVRLISDRDFLRFQALVQREAGIFLSPVKKALLVGRLAKRLRELGLATYGEYYQRAVADPAELVRMLDCISTNETHFFREPRHFQLLEDEIFPRWRAEAEAGLRPRRARIWSAACSTGEEPYSLAMSLLAAFPAGSGWELEILASDISTRALERGRNALYPISKAREIPEPHRKAFMLRGVAGQAGLMRAGPEIRDLVRFSRINLNDAAWPGLGEFDVVFCRNVLIYFAPATKERVVRRLIEHLEPGGHLFLGHAESLIGMEHPVRSVLPTVYVSRPAAEPDRAARATR